MSKQFAVRSWDGLEVLQVVSHKGARQLVKSGLAAWEDNRPGVRLQEYLEPNRKKFDRHGLSCKVDDGVIFANAAAAKAGRQTELTETIKHLPLVETRRADTVSVR